MTAVRALHQIVSPSTSHDEIAEHTALVRGQSGAVEAEAYLSLDDRARVALVELWEDEAAYARYWSTVRTATASHPVLVEDTRGDGRASSEFYSHRPFDLDRIWIASGLPESRSTIVWPARDGVRIVLQLSLQSSTELRERLGEDQATTRREPGCLQYEWFQGLDEPSHFVLLELWENQFIYDNHWHLRLKTPPPAQHLPVVERSRGQNGIEFYRHQPFQHLYDRWLPVDPHRWSETVVWPD